MDEEEFDKQVDDLTLALIYLNRFKKKDDIGWRAWKNYPFFAMDQLGMGYRSRHYSPSSFC